ncbi:cadherin-87A isoform X1 [Neodiprion pinetum]|uniref:Cadherin-87A n=1 Tax=Neodiprion lecontei TaxID=441921 RepID=A0A6J0BLV5_NEOLC|nr:cadherin-87A [Neodiprion lecontei]XP_046471514.1 cadherin-87A [Neodiprion pinetum]
MCAQTQHAWLGHSFMLKATFCSFQMFAVSNVLAVLLVSSFAVGSNVNEPPVLEAGGYPTGLPLSEATPVGSQVFVLKGHDPENSPVKYGIQLTDKFSVDPKTGIMTLAKPLDREENDTVRFRVTLEDEVPEGQQPNIVGVDAYVIVLDENDNPPRFLNVPYEAVAAEDTPPGSTILPGIRITDPDLLGDNIELSCIPQPQFPDACQKFSIVDVEKSENTYVGALVLQQPLDYRERPFYQLLLMASDGTNNSTTGVEIKVADIQNSPPEFLDSLTGVVQEDDPIGTLVMTVKARDGDRGMPRKVIYELVTNPFDYFLLDADTGELRTAKPLDREALADSTGVLTLVVKAREVIDGVPGSDNLTVSSAEATVTIKDVNDEPPSFNRREYNIEIPENVPDGTPLPHLDMTVKDPDVGTNSVFSLRLEDITGAFTVEPAMATGSTAVNIRVTNGSLDYENPNQRKFIILVIAEEVHTEPKLSSTATVTVSITDANDNAPSFNSPTYTALVSETAIPGTPVTTISAKDRDSGQFGTAGIIYQLLGQGAEHFSVDNKTGAITVAPCPTPGTAPCLDYETQTEYFLTYKATDDDGKGQTTSVSLRVGLTDANDSPPQFLQQKYRAVIDEGAEKFEPELKVQARDKDKTSKISYTIVGGNEYDLFAIDTDTGEIKIAHKGPLDVTNTTHDWIALSVQASDSTFTDTAIVNITVRDVNNNAPQFAEDLYTASIPEVSPIGTVIEEMVATDGDSGVNAELVYRIQKGAFDDFTINNASGIVTVSKKLDFDTRNTYHIEIIALDKGTPSLTGTTTLMVNVENSNDKPPYFTPETQRAEVTEDTAVGTVFAMLKAHDPDSSNEDALNFAVSGPITAIDRNGQQVSDNTTFKEFFAIDRKTGQVSVVRPLDRDIAATVSIPIIVTDTTAPALQQGKGTLVITIIDVNHLAPEFAKPWTNVNPQYKIEMQEEQPTGAVVGAFTATDGDSNIAGYAIVPPSPYFTIDNVTGIVRTTQVIDYEETKQLSFTVVAYDSGVPQLSSSAKVIVTIINVNDQDPKFDKDSYSITIKENSPPGTHVTVVKATDGDEGLFGQVSYSLVGDHAADFNIGHETGEITVGSATVLDREMTPEITIRVMASDGAPLNTRRTASVPVHIKLLDVNDNRPIFSQHAYRASVAENLSVNPPAPILQVRAADPDEGENGEVFYTIINGNENNSFTLNPETGILYPAAALLGRAGSYRIEVEARDGAGHGPHSDRCYIDVRVIPVNQHKPEFIMPELPNATVEVPENAGVPNYLVMTVKASDRDPGENGRVSYHLKVGNKNVQETEEFAIDQETGELRAKIILDREVKNKFELVLVAVDHGSPTTYETLRLLTVLLVDTNDNVPEFSGENNYNFQIMENRPKDYLIGKVVAEDKDEGRHARVYYYILSGNEGNSFYMDKSDGSIYSNKSFDREKKDNYLLSILAANDPDIYVGPQDAVHLMTHPAYGHANVTITVLDENDNPPIFERENYYAGINSMANINDFVAKVTASDPDLGENGTLFYYIASANLYKFGSEKPSGSIVPSPFNVTQDGKVVASGYMAEYNQDRFIVEVIAKETTAPERYARTRVHVWVFEAAQLIRVILSRPPEEVNREKDEIVTQLSNATQSRVVVDDIRYHVDASGHIRREWCDMYLHVVDTSQSIAAVPDVLKVIDAKYDSLQEYYAGFAIENVVPAYVGVQEEPFDPALAALIALLVVLVVGAVTVIVVCCCLRHWVITVPNDLRKKDALIKKQIIDELNTTENPLWIEQKLKLYEEQELTMQVFSEPEGGLGTERRGSGVSVGMGDTSQDNTYATIQHPLPPNRHRPTTPDYTTLPGNHNLYESAMGFQGSTFQPTPTPQLTLDRDGQPQFVSGLM